MYKCFENNYCPFFCKDWGYAVGRCKRCRGSYCFKAPKLAYLPIARQDMTGIARYIARELANPEAAEKLSVELIEAADRLSAFPYANPAYFQMKPLMHEYRKLLVQNYLMFYRVDEKTKTVTVTRVIYARRDHEKLL